MPKQPVVLTPDQLTPRLDGMLAEYDRAKAAADAAAETFDLIKAGIKAELRAAAGTEAESIVVSHPMLSKPLRLYAAESLRVDTKRMQAEATEQAKAGDNRLALLVAGYAKKSVSWTLAQVKS